MSSSLIACLPSTRSSLPASLTTYLALPSSTSHTSPSLSQTEAKIELPDIHSYLHGVHYDPAIADSLSSLCRSYCIMVIDSFRFCREKPFFHHHSAFNGTMTVPVAKLLAEPRVAAWIQESDMRMYKKMIRYIAPLVTQVVPEPVWAMFDRVSTKLVSHLVGAFEEKCPTHVVAAKVVPAARFCNLLKKLARVNQAANNVAPLLSDERTRSQMWVDMVTLVNPERLLDESMPSPECWNIVEKNLRDELRALLTPLDDDALRAVEADKSTDWSQYFATTALPGDTTSASPLSEGNLDRWIQWLEKLPEAFEGHHPQCIIDWHTRFWDSILSQLGMGGAQSFQAWWFLKAFLSSMLGWMTQMEGLLLPELEQRRLDDMERAKRLQDEGWSGLSTHHAPNTTILPSATPVPVTKRKRTREDVGGMERAAPSSRPAMSTTTNTTTVTHTHPNHNTFVPINRDSTAQASRRFNHEPTPTTTVVAEEGQREEEEEEEEEEEADGKAAVKSTAATRHDHGADDNDPHHNDDDEDDDDGDGDDDLIDHPPLELPSIDSPSQPSIPQQLKPGQDQPQDQQQEGLQQKPQRQQLESHDDSGISLDVEIEHDGLVGAVEVQPEMDLHGEREREREREQERQKEKEKRLRREWGILSDGPDAMGEVVVI
jgi:hypothetical protein